MSGINGIYKFGLESISEDILFKMNQAIGNGERDKHNSWIFQNMGISQIGKNQPESTIADGRYAVVTDGPLMNGKSLRKQLTDYEFQSDSDAETLIAAYNHWGAQMTEHLEGKFAFAIADKKEYELFIARDRFGMAPLYYFLNENIFAFSSTIKGLLASGLFQPVFAKDRLPEYFRFGTIMDENTFVRNVKNFPPANSALFSNFIFDFTPYWQPVSTQTTEDNYETSKIKIKNLFIDSVSKNLETDAQNGIFLSGGIDSTAITAAARECTQGQIRTVNISFDESNLSEAHYAKIVAKKFNTKHEEIRLKPNILLEEIDNILNAYAFPSMDGANTYMVAQAAKRAGIDIGLSGLGGDELFCGYPIFSKIKPTQRYLYCMPTFIKKMLMSQLGHNSTMRKKKTIELLSLSKPDLASVYGVFRSLMSMDDCKNMANGYRTVINAQKFFKNKQNILSDISLAEFNYYMTPILLRDTAQMSDVHSLDTRAPFLDTQLAEYILSLPASYKTKTKQPKSLLVASLSDLLPMEIVNRKKMGFVLPWDHWLRNELSPYVQNAIYILKETDVLDAKKWQAAFDDFKSGKTNYNWNIFWGVVVLTHWIKRHGL